MAVLMGILIVLVGADLCMTAYIFQQMQDRAIDRKKFSDVKFEDEEIEDLT